jgi:hypothetical protein
MCEYYRRMKSGALGTSWLKVASSRHQERHISWFLFRVSCSDTDIVSVLARNTLDMSDWCRTYILKEFINLLWKHCSIQYNRYSFNVTMDKKRSQILMYACANILNFLHKFFFCLDSSYSVTTDISTFVLMCWFKLSCLNLTSMRTMLILEYVFMLFNLTNMWVMLILVSVFKLFNLTSMRALLVPVSEVVIIYVVLLIWKLPTFLSTYVA